MKLLRLLKLYGQRGFAKWALREIKPMHPDVPGIVLRKRWLDDEIARTWKEILPDPLAHR